MSLHQSPKIITSGLNFYYDMANTKKSWKGMPTTNQFTLPLTDANGFGVQNDTFTRVRTGNYGGYDIQSSDYVWRYNISGNACPYHGWDIPTTSGQVVTFSFDFYVDPTTSNYPSTNSLAAFENLGSGVSGGLADPSPSIKGVWKKVWFSSTATATGNSRCLLYPGGCGTKLADSGFILFKNPQVEFNAPGSNPTPFVAGTRAVNQAVLDIAGTSNIITNSMTYNSDGTFSFNGGWLGITDINLGNGNIDWTVNAWVKTTTTVNALGQGSVLSNISGGPVYSMMGVNNGKIVYWTYQNSAWYQKLGVGKTVNDGNWHMLTWVNYGNYTMDMYVDGVLDSNVPNSTSGNNNPVNVIGGSWAAQFIGNISNLSKYERSLTASEVRQNFNALRGRFGV